MSRRGDRVDEPLIGVVREVHDDLRTGRDRTDDLDVEHHLAVGVLIGAGEVVAPPTLDRDHGVAASSRGRLEVLVELLLGEPAAELDDRHRLAGAPFTPVGKLYAAATWSGV